MKRLAAIVLSLPLLASTAPRPARAQETPAPETQTIGIARSGSQAPQQGPSERFTGSVRVEPLFAVNAPSRTSAGSVSFEPGARSAWHTHPLGQVLIVTAGTGRIQSWGGPVEEFRQGDVVRIPPNVKHWHGASPDEAMTHIAVQEELDGAAVVEAITHLAFYTGWPRAMSAITVAKEVFRKQP